MTWQCRSCIWAHAKDSEYCVRCQVRAKISPLYAALWFNTRAAFEGVLAETPEDAEVEMQQIREAFWSGLDAIANLLTAYAVQRRDLERRYQQDLRDESRDAQRGAREAYAEGRYDAGRRGD